MHTSASWLTRLFKHTFVLPCQGLNVGRGTLLLLRICPRPGLCRGVERVELGDVRALAESAPDARAEAVLVLLARVALDYGVNRRLAQANLDRTVVVVLEPREDAASDACGGSASSTQSAPVQKTRKYLHVRLKSRLRRHTRTNGVRS